MRLGIGGPRDVDLREGAEGALAGEPHFVSALDRALDLALDWQPRAVRVGQLLIGDVAARQLPGERQPAGCRHHGRLDAIADRNLDEAVGVLQLGDVDDRLALAADVDECHRRPDGDDGALDGLTLVVLPGLRGRREHRGEIFFGLAHKMFPRRFNSSPPAL